VEDSKDEEEGEEEEVEGVVFRSSVTIWGKWFIFHVIFKIQHTFPVNIVDSLTML